MTLDWKIEQSRLRKATELGEQVASEAGFTEAPIDPFVVVKNERGRIKAFGDDFGDDFDGRLEYRKHRFLLFYNTKYDDWQHQGRHHPKVVFTIGHELGHYFIERHRSYLMSGGGAHGSDTQFQSNRVVEREADCFSAGLLMPRFLLNKVVNRNPPTLEWVKQARDAFQVSITSMLVRWVEVCDFPCAVVSIRDNRIEWGFCSPALKRCGAYRVRRGNEITSRTTLAFIRADDSFGVHREGVGESSASLWISGDNLKFVFTEHLFVIPSTRQLLVFLTADEDDVIQSTEFHLDG